MCSVEVVGKKFATKLLRIQAKNNALLSYKTIAKLWSIVSFQLDNIAECATSRTQDQKQLRQQRVSSPWTWD